MATKRKVSKSKITGCLLLLCSVVMICLMASQLYRIYDRTVQLNEAKEKLSQLDQEYATREEELKLLDDQNYITRYARKNWIFTQKGETVIPLPDDADTTSDN